MSGYVRTAGCCDRCGAFLRWVTMESGAVMPVNPRKDPAGSVAAAPFNRRGRTRYVGGHIVTDQHPAEDGEARFRPPHRRLSADPVGADARRHPQP